MYGVKTEYRAFDNPLERDGKQIKRRPGAYNQLGSQSFKEQLKRFIVYNSKPIVTGIFHAH